MKRRMHGIIEISETKIDVREIETKNMMHKAY